MASISQQGPSAHLRLLFNVRWEWVWERDCRIPYASCCPHFLTFSLLLHWSPIGSTVLSPHWLHLIFFLYLISKGHPRLKAGKKTNLHTNATFSLRWILQPNSCHRFPTTGNLILKEWPTVEQLSKLSRLETGVGLETKVVTHLRLYNT